ncbi:MAG: hypothetical protein ACK58L_13860 [Planctomycetota bacterium]
MSENDRQLFQQIIATFDSPAYMRRSRDTEAAWNDVVTQCRSHYQSAAEIPLLRLVQVCRLCGRDLAQLVVRNSSLLREPTVDEFQAMLARWSERIQPMLLRADRSGMNGDAVLAWQTFVSSCERFNRGWQAFVVGVDLSEINRLRRDYNEYFLLEKECAVHSPLVARMEYEPLTPATHDDLIRMFPLLMPSVASPIVS